MSSMLPAMRGNFGSTEFFIVTMSAKEFSERVVIPRELEEWKEMTLEEKWQREVDYNRVKKHIAPYLAVDPDRFFGAFIVDVRNADAMNFEPLHTFLNNIPAAYRTAGTGFGFLHLQGSEIMVPLDGQHRLTAIKFAINGVDEKGKPIDGLMPNLDIGNDTCTVILIKHDARKARTIFNKVNRYAKPTSKADNLITADDDIVAVITRKNLVPLFHDRLVSHENTLSQNAPEFTTLSTLFESTKVLLEEEIGRKINTTTLPSLADQNLYTQTAVDFWTAFIDKIELVRLAIVNPQDDGDKKRKEMREGFLIGKPFAQQAIVEAILRLRVPGEDGTRLDLNIIFDRINKTDWRINNSLWQNALMRGDRILSGKQALKFAGRYIAYYLGEKLEDKEMKQLMETYKAAQPSGTQTPLPPPAF